MENAQKAIMVGVGLFITIIIISAVMLISSAGQDVIDNSMTEVNNLSDSLSRQLYSDFANSTMSGREVIAAVKKYAGQNGIKIGEGKATKDTNGKVTAVTFTTEFKADNAGSAADVIYSTGTYESNVKLDKDAKYVTDIVFTRK